MTFLFILAMVFFATATPIVIRRKRYSYEGKYLSRPARDTLRMYRRLPADNRVVSEWEVKSTLSALDTKGHDDHHKIKQHFVRTTYSGSHYAFPETSSQCGHYGRSCFYIGYVQMYNEMKAVETALAEREREIALNRVSSALGDVSAITARFRQENELIQDVTKEIVR